jgi:hypothetical protein
MRPQGPKPGTDDRVDHARTVTADNGAPVRRVHDLGVARLEDGSYQPRCSCGWSTTTYPSDDPHTAPIAAENDCIEHILEVGGEWIVVP